MLRGLLAPWFILYRLEEEITEARRYRYPLSIALLALKPPPGRRATRELLDSGVLIARASARASDLIGWLNEHEILIVLPHAREADARAAIGRWQTTMSLRERLRSSATWIGAALQDSGGCAGAQELIDAATARLEDA